MEELKYQVLAGPEGYLPPAAALMGITLPDEDEALIEGRHVTSQEGLRKIAEQLLAARNPVFFPGPLILWNWRAGVAERAIALKQLVEEIGAKIIPMPDYRPKYPMINPAIEVNPNHPNLTIWHNKIDVCVFIGVHCHYANVALKIIRGGSDCYTIAMCAEHGHEDAMVSLRDVGLPTLRELTLLVRQLKTEA